MAFVEIRRFYERNEAFIAKAALESAGLGTLVRDNGYANMYFGVSIAAGGYGLFVLDDDVPAAREILLAAVPSAPGVLNWTDHPEHLTALPVAAAGTLGGILLGAPTLIGSSRRATWILTVGTILGVAVALMFAIVLLGVI
jgi:hypothetical protein